MSRKLDTSWFDLKNYDAVKNFGLREWYNQLSIRSWMWWYADNDLERLYDWDSWLERIITAPILPAFMEETEQGKERYDINPIVKPYSVYPTSAFEFWCGAQEDRLSDVWEACEQKLKGKATETQLKLCQTPLDLLFEEHNIENEATAYLTIELDATDEQLINDFKKKLPALREARGIQSPTKNFTQKNFEEWAKSRVLPYLDLMLIAKAVQKEITQSKIAQLIFSDEDSDVDIVDRVRRTTKPKAELLMRAETVNAMEAQLKGSA